MALSRRNDLRGRREKSLQLQTDRIRSPAGVISMFIRALIAMAALALATGTTCAQTDMPLNDLKIRAEAGDKTATRQMAEAYYLGKGVEQDLKLAAYWYEKLAKQGDVRAQTSLGLLYARGYGVEKNMPLAMKWLNLAAIQRDPGAQYSLSTLYFIG